MNKVIESVNDRAADLYDRLNDEEDARVCKDISDDACHYVPVNFVLMILSSTLTKLGDEISNPKTTLTWLMNFVQAPVFLVSFLVPLRESGSMLPQLVIAAWVRRMPVRKWVWVAGSLCQAVSVAGMGLVAFHLEAATAGWAIIGLLVVFSLARGLCSVSHKDVVGKTIPKSRRGRLGGVAASVSGLLAIAVGLYFLAQSETGNSPGFYLALLLIAASLWLMAAAAFAMVREYGGATEGGGNALTKAVESLSLLRDDHAFRRFVSVRALLLCSALTAPYYIVLANEAGQSSLGGLGLFIVANGLASSLSAPFWGRMADASSRKVMISAALITGTLGIVVTAIVRLLPELGEQAWLYPLAFFVLGIAHSGVRLGRKTYVIDMAGGNKRTDYVAVSNTVIGLMLLTTGLVAALASLVSTEAVILLLSVMGLGGAILATTLPEV